MTITVGETSIASGGTQTLTHDFRRGSAHEMTYAYYFDGDSNAGDMTITWRVKPPGGTQFFNVQETDESNVDLTGGQHFIPELSGAAEHEIEITNNGASSSTVSVSTVGFK